MTKKENQSTIEVLKHIESLQLQIQKLTERFYNSEEKFNKHVANQEMFNKDLNREYNDLRHITSHPDLTNITKAIQSIKESVIDLEGELEDTDDFANHNNDRISSLEEKIQESSSLLNKVGELSMKINSMQSSFREFEKQKVDPLKEVLSSHVEKLESISKRFEDYLNSPATGSLFEVEIFKRLEKLESTKESQYCYDSFAFAFRDTINKIDERIIKLQDRIEKCEEILTTPSSKIPHKCPVCDGLGKLPYNVVYCHACDGKGVLWG